MSVTFGGVNLGFASDAHAFTAAAAWAEDRLCLRDCTEFAAADWPGRYRMSWKPDPAFIADRPVKIGSLFWPPDARNFAVAHFLVTDNQLAAIRKLYGSTYPAQTFTIDDKRGHPVSTALFPLPARPLAQRAGTNGLHLLTLVDARYFWWFRATTIDVPGSWADLFTAIGAALGLTLTVDTIPSAYLKPPPELTSRYEFLPLLLDMACRCVGMRLVRLLNGTVKVQTAGSAKTSQDAQAAAYAKEAGGAYAFVAGA